MVLLDIVNDNVGALDLALEIVELALREQVLVVEAAQGVKAPIELLHLVGMALRAVLGRNHDGHVVVVVLYGVRVRRFALVAVDARDLLVRMLAAGPVNDDCLQDSRALMAVDARVVLGRCPGFGTGLIAASIAGDGHPVVEGRWTDVQIGETDHPVQQQEHEQHGHEMAVLEPPPHLGILIGLY
jgi:hypothetical protein